MYLTYKETKNSIEVTDGISKHVSPHLHGAMEIVYVTEGTLELGVGQELYHMELGDIGIIFPDVIHHYQAFSLGENKAIYIKIPMSCIAASFIEDIQKRAPKVPVIKNVDISQEVLDALQRIMIDENQKYIIAQAYIQIILAKSLPKFELVDKSSIGSSDIIYRSVSYVSAHFREPFSLEKMALDLGVSKYALSRMFSETFHRNFNQYINDIRLKYACHRLETSHDTILEICLDSGFESQRTFNRVFKEYFHMTPKEYRTIRKSNKC